MAYRLYTTIPYSYTKLSLYTQNMHLVTFRLIQTIAYARLKTKIREGASSGCRVQGYRSSVREKK